MIEKNTVIAGLVMLIIGLGAGYFLSTPASPSTDRVGMHLMPDGSMMGAGIDQHFIVQMIPHHEGAIAMAKVALERSKRPEILSLANGIVEAQEKENADMRAWYEAWYGNTPPDSLMGGMHMDGMTGDTAKLQSVSDSEFDREFITQMIPHHEMAIMMAEMLRAGTDRAEMKTLADNIITSQSREIQMMRSWLEAWY